MKTNLLNRTNIEKVIGGMATFDDLFRHWGAAGGWPSRKPDSRLNRAR